MNNKCDLQYAKKLKELGVKQESEFYWKPDYDRINDRIAGWYEKPKNNGLYILCEKPSKYVDISNWYSAFTVGELGEMLPENIIDTGDIFYLKYYKDWVIYDHPKRIAIKVFDKSEANARAKMLVYLIENKLIEVKNV